MKIAIVRRVYSLRKGGAERQCVNLARQLMTMGHDLTFAGERIDDELRGEIRFLKVPVNQLNSWTKNTSFARNAAAVLRGEEYDISYGMSRTAGVDIYRLTERLHIHWMTIRYPGPLIRNIERFNPRHRAILRLDREIFASPTVRRLVTQSTLDRQLLMKYYDVAPERIAVLYNGVDTERFRPAEGGELEGLRQSCGLDNGQPLLLFASTMDYEGKGLRWILHAMKALEHRAARLVVLGEGPRRKFAAIARNLGIKDRVVFAGSRPDIQKYYSAADLFLMPTAYEPFPNVNLEAMACGTPVLTTDTAGGRDVIDEGRTGYLISRYDDFGQMTRCIDHHLSLPAPRRAEMSRLSREKAVELSLEKNARSVLDLFEQVLREKTRV